MAELKSKEAIKKLIALLTHADAKKGYEALKLLCELSSVNASLYEYFDVFVEMLGDKNSYVRNRGLMLIAKNAQWDQEDKLEAVIDEYLTHIHDVKAVTARQCIKLLPKLVSAKPKLRARVIEALTCKQSAAYSANMQSLIDQDIKQALKIMNETV